MFFLPFPYNPRGQGIAHVNPIQLIQSTGQSFLWSCQWERYHYNRIEWVINSHRNPRFQTIPGGSFIMFLCSLMPTQFESLVVHIENSSTHSHQDKQTGEQKSRSFWFIQQNKTRRKTGALSSSRYCKFKRNNHQQENSQQLSLIYHQKDQLL